jgi:hypothetical protein
MVLFPSIDVLVGAAFAAKVNTGEMAIAAAAAPTESSAPRRVMEKSFWVISRPVNVWFRVSGDAVARLMRGYCYQVAGTTIELIIHSLL